MTKTIDARGLSCPQPVLMTLNEIKKGNADEIIVRLDNEVSKENVSRAVISKGWAVAVMSEENGEFSLTVKKG